MSAVHLVPGSPFSFTVPSQGNQFVKSSPAVDFSGAAIDLSAWVSLELDLFAGAGNPATPLTPALSVTSGLTPNADGTVLVLLDPTVINALIPGGQANAAIYGKPTSGDPKQLIATGAVKAANF